MEIHIYDDIIKKFKSLFLFLFIFLLILLKNLNEK